MYFWLRWVFVAARGLSLVAVSGGYSLLRCVGFLWWLLLLWALGARASVVVVHRLSSCGARPSCSVACEIFLDQGLNPCPLHWQAVSQPLHHQGSPQSIFKKKKKKLNVFPNQCLVSLNFPFISQN